MYMYDTIVFFFLNQLELLRERKNFHIWHVRTHNIVLCSAWYLLETWPLEQFLCQILKWPFRVFSGQILEMSFRAISLSDTRNPFPMLVSLLPYGIVSSAKALRHNLYGKRKLGDQYVVTMPLVGGWNGKCWTS